MVKNYGHPHKKIRKTCYHCKQEGHSHIKDLGDTCRFHGEGAFCRTHHNHNNPIVNKYCVSKRGAHGRSGYRSYRGMKKGRR